ncbi:MAG: ABC transporter ATP-binding protein [Candidatus Eisenbacteria bacterium]|nr:ABC transporter ATP-binding protein [Candidatus Eisenbacteria bacterium]
MLISVQGLVKRYGELEALRGIDLELEAGGIVGILGPNGAGKTTLVETLEGLRSPTSGRVTVLGRDPASDAPALRERIGVQLQATHLPSDLTTYETLRLFRSFYEAGLQPDEVLSLVDLESKSKARVGTLSGGQKQRLAVGLALVSDPELVLLDEPTTGLDPAARRELHAVVVALRERGRSVLLTTHYIEEAEALCDRVIVMRAGEIVADGSPFELLRRSRGQSTVWIEVAGELDPVPLFQSGAKPEGRQGGHYRFVTSDPAAFVVALGRVLQDQGLELLDLRLKRPTLEDVYLELVGEEPAGDSVAPAGGMS